MLDLLIVFGADRPAGGAAMGQVIGATLGAALITGSLVWFGLRHRKGSTRLLERMASAASRGTGLPPWAALPIWIASASLLIALFGMYWDISLHIDDGRDEGPLANPAHYFILAGLYGIFVAGFIASVLPKERVTPSSVRIAEGWYAPLGGIVLLACSSFALIGFPLDDIWHRLFGQDVTLWGPTHLMLIGGAGLSLLGNAMLIVEGNRYREDPEHEGPGGLLGRIERARPALMAGGLLIGLSTFQAEFDFGVPQFRLYFQPVLIAFAAGAALVVARLYAGRGGALIAVGFFIVVRGVIALLVGPLLGEVTPHLPLYLAEAVLVELVFLRGVVRPYVQGAVAGLLVGTVGVAAEWGWSHVWMPHPWPAALLDEIWLAAPLAGVAGGVIGGFAGCALRSVKRDEGRAPALAPAVGALVVIMALVGWGLPTSVEPGIRANVQLMPAGPGHARALVTIDPPSALDEKNWFSINAWQGGGYLVDHLEPAGDGRWRSTQPVPVSGDWKTLLRLHRGDSLGGVPVWLPEDTAIPAKEVPATPQFTREFVEDKEILQREKKDDVPGFLTLIAYFIVLAIALSFVALIGWALRRMSATQPSRPLAHAG